jgi:glycine/D-amino acid oxidase-like deaminating enzyme
VDRRGFDENRACWLAEAPPYEPAPALARDQSADVAVIGGGLSGVSTAWHLSRAFPERRIVLLEARTLGSGASGRSGGQVLTGIHGVEPSEPAEIRRIYEVTRRGIDVIAGWIARHGLDAGFSRRGCIEIQTSERSAEAAHARVERWRCAGVPLEWLPASATGAAGARGAVLDPACGRVNAAALVRGMRAVLEAQGVSVYEGTSVVRIEEGRPARLATRGGEVRAAALVLATGAYTPALGYVRDGVLPLHAHVVASEPLPPERWAALAWGAHDGFSDDRDRISFGCRTAAGRLLFGGGANDAYGYSLGGDPTAPARAARRAFAALERRLAAFLPAASGVRIEHRWSGTVDLTLDRVCSMGVCGRERNIYYALGYSGHGLALAALSGRVLCDLYAGDTDRWRALPFFQRRLPRLPPEPLRWLGYQLYTRLTGRSPRRRG